MNADDVILISVDDHIAEPADMFDRHVPDKYKQFAPRVETDERGILWQGLGLGRADAADIRSPEMPLEADLRGEGIPDGVNHEQLICDEGLRIHELEIILIGEDHRLGPHDGR